MVVEIGSSSEELTPAEKVHRLVDEILSKPSTGEHSNAPSGTVEELTGVTRSGERISKKKALQ